MRKIQDYTAQELFQFLNEAAEDTQIEAKGTGEIRCVGKDGQPGKYNYRSLMETICAFSNEPDLGGGVILFGIGENQEEDDDRFFAEDIRDLDQVQCDIATQCKTIFNRPVYPELRIEKVEGKNILRIFIREMPFQQKPLYFKSDGLPRGAFRRIGSADLRCTEEDLYVFYTDSRGYDQTPIPGAMVEEVDPEALKRYRVLRSQINPYAEELLFSDQELLESLGCVCPENKKQLNLAGVLLFGSYKLQRRTIPVHRIDYIRVSGNEWVKDPEASFQSIDMLGPLLLVLYRLLEAVNADLPKGFLLREGNLQADSIGLPISVLREAIVNAMMHRSYQEGRPTQIIRYDNRIEIINAGFSLKETEDLGTPGSKSRNTVLAPVFHDTNLAETKGTGIKRMREMMAKAHLAQPTFESSRSDNTFTVRLLLHHFLCPEDITWLSRFNDVDLNDAQKTALIFVREVGAIDNTTYRQIGNCDTLKASSDLRKLRDAGLLVSQGRGSATYYIAGQRMTETNEIPQASGEIPQATDSTNQAQIHAGIPQVNGEIPQAVITDFPIELQNELRTLGKRCPRADLEALILRLCACRPLTRQNLAALLHRDESNLKKLVLKPLVETRQLNYLYPEMVKHPKQAYITPSPHGKRKE